MTTFIAARSASNPAIATSDVWPRVTAAGAPTGSTTTELQAGIVTDTAVAATATVAGNVSSIATLTSGLAAVSTQSTLIGRRGTNTAVVNSTSVNSDLWPAVTTISLATNSGVLTYVTWEIINTSGGTLLYSLLSKLNGANSLNPGSFALASSGASTSYFLDVAHVLTAGSDSSHHSQFMVFQVRPATTRSSTTSWATGYYVDPSGSGSNFAGLPLDAKQLVQSTAFDITSTVPSHEFRLNCTTAGGASSSIQRIVSEQYWLHN